MPVSVAVASLAFAAVLAMMLVEAQLSRYNERRLRGRGASEATRDVYPIMRVAYPACFLAMAVEGAFRGPSPPGVLIVGLAVLGLAKALKYWAIASLGSLWTFRVLVVAGQPRISAGPYRVLRHPNYVAVCGELLSVALVVRAPMTGVVALVGFGWLMVRRIRVEERALADAGVPGGRPAGS